MRVEINGTEYPFLAETMRVRRRADGRNSCSFRMQVTPFAGNQIFDGKLEVGYISPTTGEDVVHAARSRCVSYIPVASDEDSDFMVILGAGQYSISGPAMTDFRLIFYDEQYNFHSMIWFTAGNTWETFTVPEGARWMRFTNAATNDTTLEYMINQDWVLRPYEEWQRFIPRVGMDLKIFDGELLKFVGVIKECPVKRPGGPNGPTYCTVSSDGYNDILNRRTVTLSRKNMRAGDVVKGLISSYLHEEGISEGIISQGALVDEYSASVRSVRDIVEDMAEYSGFLWWVDEEKRLNFTEDASLQTANVLRNARFEVGDTYWERLDVDLTPGDGGLIMDSIGLAGPGSPPAAMHNTVTPVDTYTGQEVFVRIRYKTTPGGTPGDISCGVVGSVSVDGTLFPHVDYATGGSFPSYTDADTWHIGFGIATVTASTSGYLGIYIQTEPDKIVTISNAVLIDIASYPALSGLTATQINDLLGDSIVLSNSPYDLYFSPNADLVDYRNVELVENMELYRNKQFVRGDVLASGNVRRTNRSLAREIDARRRIEGGGSGVHGSVASFPWAQSYTAIGNIAEKLLEQYGKIGPPLEMKFTTNTPGFAPNQRIRVQLPALGIYHLRWFLLEEVELQERGNSIVEYTVHMTSRAQGDFSSKKTQTPEQFFNKIVSSSAQKEPETPVTNNLIYDHSFEISATTGSIDATHGDFAVTLPAMSNGLQSWGRSGSPRMISQYGSSTQEPLALFGRQAIVVNSANYVSQYVRARASTKYTVSGYVMGHPTRTTSTNSISRLQIRFYNAAFTAIGTAEGGQLILGQPHNPATVIDDQKRHVETITTPANTAWVRVYCMGALGGNSWVIWDGIQMVQGDTAGMYEPENSLFAMFRAGAI